MLTLSRSVLVFALVAMTLPASALAWHSAFPRSTNIIPLGESAQPNPDTVSGTAFNSDIAFWGNYAVEGSYDGFRVLDISNPASPAEVTEVKCGWSQGDITISPDGNVVVRSQDSPRVLPGNNPAQACTDSGTGNATTGWEGLQIFDFRNKANPTFVGAVYTDCGSHTHTQYHDRANNRLIIYVSRGGCTITPGANPYGGQSWGPNFGGGCITAVEVPLANPAGAQVVNRCIPAGNNGCHDVGVYEGINRLYGACRPNMILWDISNPVAPTQLHEHGYPGIGGWHSAAISWNGELLLAGWEPGGGGAPRCMATGAPLNPANPGGDVQTDAMKTIFVFRASDGALIGRWVLPREQSRTENCTIHNYAFAPFVDRHIIVQGSYQSGSSVIDFTNPANAQEIAWVDPPPLSTTQLILGGAWSTHWYNDFIYESDIPRGVAIYDVAEPWWETHSIELPFLNPQTMTETLRCTVRATGRLRARRAARLNVTVRVNAQAVAGVDVTLRGPGVRRSLETNAAGRATAAVKPRRRGTLRVTGNELNIMAPCSTSRRIAAAPRPVRPAPTLTGRQG